MTHNGATMAKTHATSVDAYIASQPAAVRDILERVRSTIRKTLPGADEVISYGIPAFTLRGRAVIYFAGWKQHYAIYPATAGIVTTFEDDLADLEVSKGTIRFPLSEPVPVKLIGRIAKFRAKEIETRT